MTTSLADLKLAASGKVREIYEDGDELVMVASDRISVYDVILPTEIPDKGKVLTQMSFFWFELTGEIVPNHFISEDVPPEAAGSGHAGPASSTCIRSSASSAATSRARAGRSTSESGAVCGIELPEGPPSRTSCPSRSSPRRPRRSSASTTRTSTSIGRPRSLGNRPLAEELRRISIEIYERAAEHAAERGIIVADTKFEFGSSAGAEIVLGDEVLTPDSSRFWPADDYEPGRSQASFDKQYVRDYSDSIGWDHTEPGPELPDEVVQNTRAQVRRGLREDHRPQARLSDARVRRRRNPFVAKPSCASLG